MKCLGSKVRYPIYKNYNHIDTIYIYWHSKAKFAPLHHLMCLLSYVSESEIFPVHVNTSPSVSIYFLIAGLNRYLFDKCLIAIKKNLS